jgi:hypothetical protein
LIFICSGCLLERGLGLFLPRELQSSLKSALALGEDRLDVLALGFLWRF